MAYSIPFLETLSSKSDLQIEYWYNIFVQKDKHIDVEQAVELARTEERYCQPTSTRDQHYQEIRERLHAILSQERLSWAKEDFANFGAAYFDLTQVLVNLRDRIFKFENRADPFWRDNPDCFVFETHGGRVVMVEHERDHFDLFIRQGDHFNGQEVHIRNAARQQFFSKVIIGTREMDFDDAAHSPKVRECLRATATDLRASYPKFFQKDDAMRMLLREDEERDLPT